MEKNTKDLIPSGIVTNIIKGFLIIFPLVVIYWFCVQIKNIVFGYSRPFLPYIPQGELITHPQWHWVGALTIVILLWICGVLNQYKIFGKNINGWLDTFFMYIPVIKTVYGFTNQLAEALLRKIDEMKNNGKNGVQKKGEPVFYDYYKKGCPQLCYKMSSRRVILYNREYKQIMPHYSINVPSAGMPPNGLGVFVPCFLIDDQEVNQTDSFTMEEAIKYNALAGSIIPDRFFEKIES